MVMISKKRPRGFGSKDPGTSMTFAPMEDRVPILQGADAPLINFGAGPDLSNVDPGAPPMKRGIFDRIKDFAGSDMGRAALLRSGAATLNDGLGAGIMAGADYVDKQKAMASEKDNFLVQMALKQQGVDIDRQEADQRGERYQNQSIAEALALGLDREKFGEYRRSNSAKEAQERAELAEAERKARAGEALTQRELALRARAQDIDWQKHSTPSASTKYAADSSRVMGLVTAAGKNAPQTSTAVETGPDGKPKKTTTTTKSIGGYAPEVFEYQGRRWTLDPMTGQPVQVP